MLKALDSEGKRLKYIRENILNVSQEAFGTPIAKHPTAIQKWESGINTIEPSVKLLFEQFYGINPVWLETGLGEIIFERRSLNAYVMPVYMLSGKSYADLFSKDNIVSSKSIVDSALTYNLSHISLIVANKSVPGIEKDDLLVVSTELGKNKNPEHYLVEDKGALDVRLLQYLAKNNSIVEVSYSKASEINGFPFNMAIATLDEDQIKGKVVNTIAASLWKNASVILI